MKREEDQHVTISQDEWTLETLRVYLEERINALHLLLDERAEDQRRAMEAALASAEKAVGKAELAAEKRFDSVNEFRGQLTDQALTFMTRTEYEAGHQRLQEQVANLADTTNHFATRAEAGAIHDRFTEQINDLKDRMNRREGNGDGKAQLWGYFAAAIAIIGTIVIVTNLLIAGK
jgi:hypothetical protein